MNTITIRDEYGNEFEVDASARPFWENRPGCQIFDDSPAGQGAEVERSVPVDHPESPKPSSRPDRIKDK